MWHEICNRLRIACTLQGQHVDTLDGEKYYCDTCIVVFVMRNAFRHHSRSDTHRKKLRN